MILYTSNKSKQIEFKRLFGNFDKITITSGNESPEVLGTINEIIIYKSLAAGDNSIVEDTTAIINCKQFIDVELAAEGILDKGDIVTEIKHRYTELKTGDYIKNISSLAINRDGEILVFRGTMFGIIDRSLGNTGLASFMVPIIGQYTLNGTFEDFTNRGFSDLISWRAMAVRKFKLFEDIKRGANPTPYLWDNCQPSLRVKIKDIPSWIGEYQKD